MEHPVVAASLLTLWQTDFVAQFPEYILIAGSASPSAVPDNLKAAHDFVDELVPQLLSRGIGIIVFAADEVSFPGSAYQLIFDWTALLAACRFQAESGSSHGNVVVVTSAKLDERRSQANRDLLLRLRRNGMITVRTIPDETHTGGSIVSESLTAATGLIAINGGKGVTARARPLQNSGKVVIPLDFRLGASKGDGLGAAGLFQELPRTPQSFLPGSADHDYSRVPGPEALLANPRQSAQTVAALLQDALPRARRRRPCDVLLLTALPLEAQPLLTLLELAGFSPTIVGGLSTWRSCLPTDSGPSLDICVACLGRAGTTSGATKSASLLKDLQPRLTLLVGIAAGMKGKHELGEVVFAESVVAYEPAAVTETEDRTALSPRPNVFSPGPEAWQAVVSLLSDAPSLAGIRTASDTPILLSTAVFASGDKLLRSTTFFADLKKTHGRISCAEMEAAGVAESCAQLRVPFLMIRGISDHGDAAKEDEAQPVAAENAATVAVTYLRRTGFSIPRRGA